MDLTDKLVKAPGSNHISSFPSLQGEGCSTWKITTTFHRVRLLKEFKL